ncbi:MAG TPA: type VII secretion protein EccB [Nocardioides sp.]|nr:type VII secretion protein EccB [Nocardioides sp.]
MATKKDLVEAYSFSRRRLVTAFVSGAPGGREVEPARPGRTIVGGVALAVLLMAGAAIAGVFDPKTSIDFDEPAFIIAKDNGSIYVVVDRQPGDTEPALRPITNVTSAQLILGSDVEPVSVPLDEIQEHKTGPTIGILDAPPTVPEESDLIQSGWTSCTGTGLGIKTQVTESPQVSPTPEAGFVVKRKDEFFLIAEQPATPTRPARAYRYALPENDSLNRALGVALSEDAVEVPEPWLLLFDAGGSLDADGLALDGAGERPNFSGSEQLPGKMRIGDYFYDVNDEPAVITEKGVATFSDFALRVLINTTFGDFRPEEFEVGLDAELTSASPPYRDPDAHWPETTLSPAEGELCAQLHAEQDAQPQVLIAQAPTGEASAEDVDDPAAEESSVDSGHGAYVMSGGFGDTTDGAEPVLIDERGRAYPLVGPETPGQLGYEDDDWVLVPDTWVDLFGEGVELSKDAALCPPTSEKGKETCQ